MSTELATVIGVVLLALAALAGVVVGPKWWHWGSFVVLTLVLFVPLMMSFFIPLPMVIILNVAISHNVWLRRHPADTPQAAAH